MGRRIIRCCADRWLPGDRLLGYLRRRESDGKLAAAAAKLWQDRAQLRVLFLNGEPPLQRRVLRAARLWQEHCGIQFVASDGPVAEIRVTFVDGPSWSFVGTDALDARIPLAQPTMNLGGLRRWTPADDLRAVTLHEFGHALGLIHEHQSPAAAIPWNKPAVYDYYAGPPNYWTPEQVERNLFGLYDGEVTQYSHFDPQSIMLYPIDPALTLDGSATGWNRALSETDKSFVGQLYPRLPDSASSTEHS
jgi:hypothetical protein